LLRRNFSAAFKKPYYIAASGNCSGAEMDILNFRAVVIERRKILDYLLSPIHHVGQYKAEFFQSLGYHQLVWKVLERDIRDLLKGQLLRGGETPHGTKYTLSGWIIGPNGKSARILTVWIVPPAHNVLRFVTAYPES
jgi:hypothetical protein